MAAWGDALCEKGLVVKDAYWVEGNWSSSSGAEAVEKLFVQYPEMDAIFVANDQMALSVQQAVHKRGIRIPEDIGVVGFDNIPEAAYFYPSLTTIQQDQFDVARVAMHEIFQIIGCGWQGEEPPAPRSIMISPTLVERESSVRNSKAGGPILGNN